MPKNYKQYQMKKQDGEVVRAKLPPEVMKKLKADTIKQDRSVNYILNAIVAKHYNVKTN